MSISRTLLFEVPNTPTWRVEGDLVSRVIMGGGGG